MNIPGKDRAGESHPNHQFQKKKRTTSLLSPLASTGGTKSCLADLSLDRPDEVLILKSPHTFPPILNPRVHVSGVLEGMGNGEVL